MTDLSKLKIALVYDRVTKWGGAERVLLALHDLFPQAPLYTSVYSPQNAAWAAIFPKVIPSFLQKLSFLINHHELIPWLMPIAFEQFDFSNYDLVISVTSESAKGIITKPSTKHICYCLTPTRYLYGQSSIYLTNPLYRFVAKYLRLWDQIAARRPDHYFAISQTVQQRITNYYSLPSSVVYPPVDTDFFRPSPTSQGNYFLIVSRLVKYKDIDKIIQIFNMLPHGLIIVGTGSQEGYLKSIANSNTQFLGLIPDEILRKYYQNCQALLYLHEEDFGLVPLEAMACGKPVIALNTGGATETIIPGQTGILLDDISQLAKTLKSFNSSMYNQITIRNHVLKFSHTAFRKNFLSLV